MRKALINFLEEVFDLTGGFNVSVTVWTARLNF